MAIHKRQSWFNDLVSVAKDLPELVSEGLTVIGPPHPRCAATPLVKTLVQVDGDLCLSIHTDAPALEEFNIRIRQHIAEVRRKIERFHVAYRVLQNFRKVVGGGACALGVFNLTFEVVYGGKNIAELVTRPDWLLLGSFATFLLAAFSKYIAAFCIRWLVMRRFNAAFSQTER